MNILKQLHEYDVWCNLVCEVLFYPDFAMYE
jgi:hypothetical protein